MSYFDIWHITDPMLPSGETDLIGASSDIDSDKGQGQVTLDISSPDITTSSSWIFISVWATDSTRSHLETSANTEVNFMYCCPNVTKNLKINSFSNEKCSKKQTYKTRTMFCVVWQVFFPRDILVWWSLNAGVWYSTKLCMAVETIEPFSPWKMMHVVFFFVDV